MVQFCKLCGSELIEGKNFCPECGSPVNKTDEDSHNENVNTSEDMNIHNYQKIDADDFLGNNKKYTDNGKFSGINNKGYTEVEYDTGEVVLTTGPICGILSVTLGIFSMICCCWFGFLGLLFSIPAIILGILSFKRKESNQGLAIVGIVCASIGLLLSVFMGISSLLYTKIVDNASDNLKKLSEIDSIDELLDALKDFLR